MYGIERMIISYVVWDLLLELWIGRQHPFNGDFSRSPTPKSYEIFGFSADFTTDFKFVKVIGFKSIVETRHFA